MDPAPAKSRAQIALVEVPLVEITHARTHRLVEDRGWLDVLGNQCRVMTDDRHLEFWIGARRFEISLEDLVATAGKALEARLRCEIRDRVIAAQGRAPDVEQDGFVTLHPTVS